MHVHICFHLHFMSCLLEVHCLCSCIKLYWRKTSLTTTTTTIIDIYHNESSMMNSFFTSLVTWWIIILHLPVTITNHLSFIIVLHHYHHHSFQNQGLLVSAVNPEDLFSYNFTPKQSLGSGQNLQLLSGPLGFGNRRRRSWTD